MSGTARIYNFSAGPAVPWTGRCPTLGEHTDEVLRELGLPADRIKALRDQGLLG